MSDRKKTVRSVIYDHIPTTWWKSVWWILG